jgi:hypothetical protein
MHRHGGAYRVEVDRDEARLLHGVLVERYVHGPLRLEQRFEPGDRPEGEGPIAFETSLRGLRAESGGSGEAERRAMPVRLEAAGYGYWSSTTATRAAR